MMSTSRILPQTYREELCALKRNCWKALKPRAKSLLFRFCQTGAPDTRGFSRGGVGAANLLSCV